MSFALHHIPGYLEALRESKEADFTTREDAWWNMTFDVGGVLIRTMTVRDYEMLLRQRSPLLLRQMPCPEDMIMFLWLLSPEIERWEQSAGWLAGWRRERCRRKHQRQAEKALDMESFMWLEKAHELKNPGQPFTVPDDCAYSKVFAACLKYIDRMFYDRPAGMKKNGHGSGASYLTDWFCNLQREFHLPTAEIERMPIPELFARLKEIQGHHNPTIPDFNKRADDLNKQVMDALRSGMTQQDLMEGKLKFRRN